MQQQKQHQHQYQHQKNNNNNHDIRNQIVLIPALVSSRQTDKPRPREPQKPQTPSDPKTRKTATTNQTNHNTVIDQIKENLNSENEYFKRGRYLRSSYDRSLLMYSERDSGLHDSTNNPSTHATPRHQHAYTTTNSGYSNSTIDKMVQKFRSKLQGLKSKDKDAKETAGADDTLII